MKIKEFYAVCSGHEFSGDDYISTDAIFLTEEDAKKCIIGEMNELLDEIDVDINQMKKVQYGYHEVYKNEAGSVCFDNFTINIYDQFHQWEINTVKVPAGCETNVEIPLEDDEFLVAVGPGGVQFFDEDEIPREGETIHKVKQVSIDDVEKFYKKGVIQIIDSPHGDGPVCQIGDLWFYIDVEADEVFQSAEEYKENNPEDTIIQTIFQSLEGLFYNDYATDEYAYVAWYLQED